MKRNSLIAALVMGMFIVAGVSPALAEWYDPAQLDRKEAEGQDLGRYEFSAPVETGNLPKGEVLSAGEYGIMEGFDVHESGAVTFRNGIDDGP